MKTASRKVQPESASPRRPAGGPGRRKEKPRTSPSEFAPPDRALAKRDANEALAFLAGLRIESPFDATIVLHQIRAGRPVRWFEGGRHPGRPLQLGVGRFGLDTVRVDWTRVMSAVERGFARTTGFSISRPRRLEDLMGVCLASEFVEWPVVVRWSPGAARELTRHPLPLARLLVWDSQLWTHCAATKADRQALEEAGLDPALVRETPPDAGGPDLCPRRAFELAREAFRSHALAQQQGPANLVNRLARRLPYVPGLWVLGRLSTPASVLDSLSFQDEERDVRRQAFLLAEQAMTGRVGRAADARETSLHAVDCLFALRSPYPLAAVCDTSLAFRRRSRADFLLAQVSRPELRGIIDWIVARLFHRLPPSRPTAKGPRAGQGTTVGPGLAPFPPSPPGGGPGLGKRGLAARLRVLTGCPRVVLDDSDRLARLLDDPRISLACFLDGAPPEALDLFVAEPLGARLSASRRGEATGQVVVFTSDGPYELAGGPSDRLHRLLQTEAAQTARQAGLLQFVRTDRQSSGVNLRELGLHALQLLERLAAEDAVLVAAGPDALETAWSVGMRTAVVGRADAGPVALALGVSPGTGYVVVGGRTECLCEGFPLVARGLAQLRQRPSGLRRPVAAGLVTCRTVRGLSEDGAPFEARVVELTRDGRAASLLDLWRSPRLTPLDRIVTQYERRTGRRVAAAFNAGYFIDPRLAADRGLPPEAVGRHLGLLRVEGRTLLVPTHGCRPVFVAGEDGSVAILDAGAVLVEWLLESRAPCRFAIEAGPRLIGGGRLGLDLEREGWTSAESRALQVAPVHYSDLRTARTCVAVLQDGALVIVAVKGRTAESVGMTHGELAELLLGEFRGRILDAMEFDSGGSSTLYALGEVQTVASWQLSEAKGRSSRRFGPRPIATAILLSLEERTRHMGILK